MPEIVVRDRVVGRLLAILPAAVITVAVRTLTIGSPPVALRLLAASLVALSAWTAYRILTAQVTVTDEELRVRGVLYDATVPLADLRAVTVVEPAWPVRALVWGLLEARAVRLATSSGSLRPLAMLSAEGDDEVARAVRALLARAGTRLVPAQRESSETGIPTA